VWCGRCAHIGASSYARRLSTVVLCGLVCACLRAVFSLVDQVGPDVTGERQALEKLVAQLNSSVARLPSLGGSSASLDFELNTSFEVALDESRDELSVECGSERLLESSCHVALGMSSVAVDDAPGGTEEAQWAAEESRLSELRSIREQAIAAHTELQQSSGAPSSLRSATFAPPHAAAAAAAAAVDSASGIQKQVVGASGGRSGVPKGAGHGHSDKHHTQRTKRSKKHSSARKHRCVLRVAWQIHTHTPIERERERCRSYICLYLVYV
jgi:hypothetical protein